MERDAVADPNEPGKDERITNLEKAIDTLKDLIVQQNAQHQNLVLSLMDQIKNLQQNHNPAQTSNVQRYEVIHSINNDDCILRVVEQESYQCSAQSATQLKKNKRQKATKKINALNDICKKQSLQRIIVYVKHPDDHNYNDPWRAPFIALGLRSWRHKTFGTDEYARQFLCMKRKKFKKYLWKSARRSANMELDDDSDVEGIPSDLDDLPIHALSSSKKSFTVLTDTPDFHTAAYEPHVQLDDDDEFYHEGFGMVISDTSKRSLQEGVSSPHKKQKRQQSDIEQAVKDSRTENTGWPQLNTSRALELNHSTVNLPSKSVDDQLEQMKRHLDKLIQEMESDWRTHVFPSVDQYKIWKTLRRDPTFQRKLQDELTHKQQLLDRMKQSLLEEYKGTSETVFLKASDKHLRSNVYRITELTSMLYLGQLAKAPEKLSKKSKTHKSKVSEDDVSDTLSGEQSQPPQTQRQPEAPHNSVQDHDTNQSEEDDELDLDLEQPPSNKTKATKAVHAKPVKQPELIVISDDDGEKSNAEDELPMSQAPPMRLLKKQSQVATKKITSSFVTMSGGNTVTRLISQPRENPVDLMANINKLFESDDMADKSMALFMLRKAMVEYPPHVFDIRNCGPIKDCLLDYLNQINPPHQKNNTAKPTKKPTSSSQDNATPSGKKGRREIRAILDESQLNAETRAALEQERIRRKEAQEYERRKQAKTQQNILEMMSHQPSTQQLQPVSTEPEVAINPGQADETMIPRELVALLKPHQVEAAQFLWENIVGVGGGSGCLLAHEMGLGKTLSTITFIHLFLQKNVGHKALIIVPVSVLQNWKNEFDKWIYSKLKTITYRVFLLDNKLKPHERHLHVSKWHSRGGVLIMGYSLFKRLLGPLPKFEEQQRDDFRKALADPGPDCVVVDEAHNIKNPESAISKALKMIKTHRRICLTGYPLQNNLTEYWCMVDFVKPNFLGTRDEFKNMFENPISNGRHADSTPLDVALARKRTYVLHKKLQPIVLRRDNSLLKTMLPPKAEFVIVCKLTKLQRSLYQAYVDKQAGKSLFNDFAVLTLIGNHPQILKDYIVEKKGIANISQDFDEPLAEPSNAVSDVLTAQGNNNTSNNENNNNNQSESTGNIAVNGNAEIHQWMNEYLHTDMSGHDQSSKVVALLEIVSAATKIREKTLVFSHSLSTLTFLEEVLKEHAYNYFRLDGNTKQLERQKLIDQFNHKDSKETVFLISTRAGGLGINLNGASRVVLFDLTWNPSHDVEATCRIFRLGQERPTFIYRLQNEGTIEEKVYRRQVQKESLAKRVVDSQPTSRLFKADDLEQLYALTVGESAIESEFILYPDTEDPAIIELAHCTQHVIAINRHDSLLKPDQNEAIAEEEKKDAEAEYQTAITKLQQEKDNPPPPDIRKNVDSKPQSKQSTISNHLPKHPATPFKPTNTNGCPVSRQWIQYLQQNHNLEAIKQSMSTQELQQIEDWWLERFRIAASKFKQPLSVSVIQSDATINFGRSCMSQNSDQVKYAAVLASILSNTQSFLESKQTTPTNDNVSLRLTISNTQATSQNIQVDVIAALRKLDVSTPEELRSKEFQERFTAFIRQNSSQHQVLEYIQYFNNFIALPDAWQRIQGWL